MDFKMHLQCLGTCCSGDKLWFPNMTFNGLFSINLKNFELEYHGQIPFLDNFAVLSYAHSNFFFENKLFFCPNNCKDILIYDIENKTYNKINILSKDNYLTARTIQRGKKVWIYPQNLKHGIFFLNLDDLSIEESIEFNQLLAGIQDIPWIVELNEFEIAILSGDKEIIEVNILKKEIIDKKILKEDIRIFSIRYYGGSYWILFKDSSDIYEIVRKENKIIKYHLFEEEWITKKGIPYSNAIFIEDDILLLNYRLKYIMKIDKKSKTIKKAVDYPVGFKFLLNRFYNGWAAFASFDIFENKILIYPIIGNMMLIYDIEKETIEGKELLISTQDIPFLKKDSPINMFENNGYYCETEDFSKIQNFCNIINKNILIEQKNRIKFGKKIYKSML